MNKQTNWKSGAVSRLIKIYLIAGATIYLIVNHIATSYMCATIIQAIKYYVPYSGFLSQGF